MPGLDLNHWKGVGWKIVGDASQAEYFVTSNQSENKIPNPRISTHILHRNDIASVVGPNYPD